MATRSGCWRTPVTLLMRTITMVSELVTNKLADVDDDPGGGFTPWKLDLRPQTQIKSGFRWSFHSRSLTKTDDDLGDEIGRSRSTGRFHKGVGVAFQMRSDSQELAGVEGILPKDRSNDLNLQVLDEIVSDFEERIDRRFKALEEKLDMKHDVLIKLIERLYHASNAQGKGKLKFLKADVADSLRRTDTQDEEEIDLYQARVARNHQSTGFRAVKSTAMVKGFHCDDDSLSRTPRRLPIVLSNSQGVGSAHRLKRKRGFEDEGNEKNTIKFRIVGCEGWNEDEEADLVPIRDNYEMFDVMPSWEEEDGDKEKIDSHIFTAINMDSSPEEVLDALGCEFLKDVGLDVVVEALNNVIARIYMNMGCWFFQELLSISKLLSPLKPPPKPPPWFTGSGVPQQDSLIFFKIQICQVLNWLLQRLKRRQYKYTVVFDGGEGEVPG